jgi:hypothetical protein
MMRQRSCGLRCDARVGRPTAAAALLPLAAGCRPAAPARLRLSRAKGFDLQAHSRALNGLPAVNVARPSKWGNPFNWKDCSPDAGPAEWAKGAAVDMFRDLVAPKPPHIVALYMSREDIVRALRGRNLACHCALDQPCHADVLLEIANRPISEG